MNNNLIVKLSKCFHSIVSVHEWNNIACRRQSEEVRRVSYGVLMSLRSILLYLREKKAMNAIPRLNVDNLPLRLHCPKALQVVGFRTRGCC